MPTSCSYPIKNCGGDSKNEPTRAFSRSAQPSHIFFQAVWRTQLFDESPEINSGNLLVLLVPLDFQLHKSPAPFYSDQLFISDSER